MHVQHDAGNSWGITHADSPQVLTTDGLSSTHDLQAKIYESIEKCTFFQSYFISLYTFIT